MDSMIIIAIVLLGAIGTTLMVTWLLLCDYVNSKKKYYDELAKTEMYKQQREMMRYSDQTLKFIREFITTIGLLKYRTYQDNMLLEKITRENLGRFVETVIKDIKIALSEEKINPDYLVYDQNCINQYIIDTTMIIIKQIFDESVDATADQNLIIE